MPYADRDSRGNRILATSDDGSARITDLGDGRYRVKLTRRGRFAIESMHVDDGGGNVVLACRVVETPTAPGDAVPEGRRG